MYKNDAQHISNFSLYLMMQPKKKEGLSVSYDDVVHILRRQESVKPIVILSPGFDWVARVRHYRTHA